MPTENTTRFIPRKGLSENLNRCEVAEGQFVISLDDRKLYMDAIVDGTLQRLPLGGDINTAIINWDMVRNKPFSEISELDFSVQDNVLFAGDNLRFSNKAILDLFQIDNSNNNILYNVYSLMTDSYNTNIYEIPSQQDSNDIILQVWGA